MTNVGGLQAVEELLNYASQRYAVVRYGATYFWIAKWVFYLIMIEFFIRFVLTTVKIVKKTYQPMPITIYCFGLRERDRLIERTRVPTAVLVGELLLKSIGEILYNLIISTVWILWVPLIVILSAIFYKPLTLFNYDHVKRRRRRSQRHKSLDGNQIQDIDYDGIEKTESDDQGDSLSSSHD
jgi:hypothetical protein